VFRFSPEFLLVPSKLVYRQTADHISASLDREQMLVDKTVHVILFREPDEKLDITFLLAVLNSRISDYIYASLSKEEDRAFAQVKAFRVKQLPIPRISFTTPADIRAQQFAALAGVYSARDDAGVLQGVATSLAAGQSDVVHDLLAHLAQQMIDLNKQKQAEVTRFLGWLEKTLHIIAKKNGDTGLDSLPGKTFLRGYLGDYQKGEPETAWADYYYRLHQNRNRFGVSLASVEAAIKREYEASLNTLLPLKQQLARTDALIDKIVYQLYGLTDAEIELIERPAYEQALAEAKSSVFADDKIKDPEEKIDRIAEAILPAAQRYFERVDPRDVEAALDIDLPHWRALPPDAPTFLRTGDYNLRSLPGSMDFSSSVIPYAKAVEVVLLRRLFEPFRLAHADGDCRNEFLQKYMRGEKELTLGSLMIILSSSQETALRGFISRLVGDVQLLAQTLNDEAMRLIRNKAAHNEVINREEADATRTWALAVLGLMG
jgi:hypothetical protein